MNRIDMERIKHSTAELIFAGTEYDWWDMLDNTEEQDRQAMEMTTKEQNIFWEKYFIGLLESMRNDQ